MERLDVAFANRYLAALDGFRRNEPLSNNILGGMILNVRTDVEELSPWIKFLDQLAPRPRIESLTSVSIKRGPARGRVLLTVSIG